MKVRDVPAERDGSSRPQALHQTRVVCLKLCEETELSKSVLRSLMTPSPLNSMNGRIAHRPVLAPCKLP
jgi:hypothetical protein